MIKGFVQICKGEVRGRVDPAQVLVEGSNLITSLGLEKIAQLCLGRLIPPEAIGWGSGTTPASPADVALETELGRKPLTRRLVSGPTATFQMLVRDDEANGQTISEAALFDSSIALGGICLARFVHTPVPKDSGIVLTYVWSWDFS